MCNKYLCVYFLGFYNVWYVCRKYYNLGIKWDLNIIISKSKMSNISDFIRNILICEFCFNDNSLLFVDNCFYFI